MTAAPAAACRAAPDARLVIHMNPLCKFVALTYLAANASGSEPSSAALRPLSLQNANGLQLLVPSEIVQPVLRIVLPGQANSDRSIEVLFPEHVTALKQGSTTAEHLYLFRDGSQGEPPVWRQTGQSLEYTRDLPRDIQMLARATLEDDGVRFHYEFKNASDISYHWISAVTDPRLTGILHDVRLERTYVHHAEGFDLLASEVPSRLTTPLDQLLPARFLASYTWPVPSQRVEKRGDGITYYNKARAVDVPFLATLSSDKGWVVASFAREPGNVWSNPELTCQHVDPQASLPPRQRVVLEVKLLAMRGSLEDAFQRPIRQRESLR